MSLLINRRDWIKIVGASVGAAGFMPKLLWSQIKTDDENDLLEDVLVSQPYFDKYEQGDLLYENPLQTQSDVERFRLEGKAQISFPQNWMRMENLLDPSLGQKANFVYWCPEEFPDNVAISWDFRPLQEPGLCILFFAARGKNGKDIFDPSLAKREGKYKQYHHGDINAFHVSYFRRRSELTRAFHLCNLRKSYGHNMVAQGADPLPSVKDAAASYRIRVVKAGDTVDFYINELHVLTWTDDGKTYGSLLSGGKIGFRQMAPLVAEYRDLKVHLVSHRK
jgi:hypothetical protein